MTVNISDLLNSATGETVPPVDWVSDASRLTYIINASELYGIFQDIQNTGDINDRYQALGLYFKMLNEITIHVMNYIRTERYQQLQDINSVEYRYYQALENSYHMNTGNTPDAVESYLDNLVGQDFVGVLRAAKPAVQYTTLSYIQKCIKKSGFKVKQRAEGETGIRFANEPDPPFIDDFCVSLYGNGNANGLITVQALEDLAENIQQALASNNQGIVDFLNEQMSLLSEIIVEVAKNHTRALVIYNCTDDPCTPNIPNTDKIRVDGNIYWVHVLFTVGGVEYDYTSSFRTYLNTVRNCFHNPPKTLSEVILALKAMYDSTYALFYDDDATPRATHIRDYALEPSLIDRYREMMNQYGQLRKAAIAGNPYAGPVPEGNGTFTTEPQQGTLIFSAPDMWELLYYGLNIKGEADAAQAMNILERGLRYNIERMIDYVENHGQGDGKLVDIPSVREYRDSIVATISSDAVDESARVRVCDMAMTLLNPEMYKYIDVKKFMMKTAEVRELCTLWFSDVSCRESTGTQLFSYRQIVYLWNMFNSDKFDKNKYGKEYNMFGQIVLAVADDVIKYLLNQIPDKQYGDRDWKNAYVLRLQGALSSFNNGFITIQELVEAVLEDEHSIFVVDLAQCSVNSGYVDGIYVVLKYIEGTAASNIFKSSSAWELAMKN